METMSVQRSFTKSSPHKSPVSNLVLSKTALNLRGLAAAVARGQSTGTVGAAAVDFLQVEHGLLEEQRDQKKRGYEEWWMAVLKVALLEKLTPP